MKLAGRLILGTMLVIVGSITALVWRADRTLQRDLEGDIRGSLEREARLDDKVLPPPVGTARLKTPGGNAAFWRHDASTWLRACITGSALRPAAATCAASVSRWASNCAR